ncbi:UDP-N-acetylmuramoyl-tripeptide--D-alanyl-D-alanine ligase [Virgibacillus pantothenticus]|uniref:UDP-N-acetylmuramoyl-tripeptide--D-alanyl-D- alanine ligase n=1 Tax=Virgibacillus TaxID=84406 RepID=UPI00090A0EE2|nr:MULTISPECIES: UDP-N-acetylmuramoyl-tripeptide--D-alanyl-D-alanine ligase [Virgibacillus]API93796.1 UDP-N-acetylmuramoylalanyl-D-glutamate--2,6-diaminopimelate ligase [Virgibacillus sp. 6R]MBS7429787.1 UDP-N-acetylmuramoyl-tripeptide--D-alanyl-D-alanine ligase [Virgibacillus sp. 19R1-5]MBU8565119.1 UDP-N-acetylmuramoyl-tripeptide--D-alanyl-D-alanine ligase [Virgibacillus pantothenticus]MBU8601065.1 UDP-N-acetylmuramoyl-tripeptide--D-alanyl-D-alanine ligase [Virgibacillus pantothenticus]MBU86
MFTVKWLAQMFHPYTGHIAEQSIKGVYTDSRIEMADGLFVPIVGENFDGHDYVSEAVEKGAIAVLWNKQKQLPDTLPASLVVFYVEDTLTALQQLASAYREKMNPIVIGITGSNGKTTTKDMVAALLQTTYRTHYTKGNFNNHIGLPLTILSMQPNTEVLVVEMGMNHAGEIKLLSNIAKLDYAIITNIGESHIEYLGSRENIAKAKLEILSGLSKTGLLVIDGDEPLLQQFHNQERVITCGFAKHNVNQITSLQVHDNETSFTINENANYTIPFLGKHHAKNATLAITIGMSLKIEAGKMQSAFRHMQKTGMRFEKLRGKNGVTLINDAYNASATSMKAAIEVVKQLDGYSEKVLVLGDILELGDYSEVMHRSVSEAITKPITNVYTFGNAAKYITEELVEQSGSIPASHYTDKNALLNALQPHLHEEAIILFKASRGLQFETFITDLKQ